MKRLLSLILTFLFWTLVGSVGKVAFMLSHRVLFEGTGLADWMDVILHGLRLDMAIAGYISLVAGLLLMVSVWHSGRLLSWLWHAYSVLVATVVSVATVVNIGLYGYWGFPLDATPLLYLRTSPKDAMASLTAWQLVGWILVLVVTVVCVSCLAIAFSKGMERLFGRARRQDRSCGSSWFGRRRVSWHHRPVTYRTYPGATSASPLRRLGQTIVILLFTAALIIPIRGGFSTGTNHTGSVYYSTNIRLNHAAVNPLFCFIESVTHQQDIGSMYRFMDDDEADRLFSGLTYTAQRPDSVPVPRIAVPGDTLKKPNVVVILLESFSKYIMAEKGHVKGVVPRLEALTREGIYFTQFYASSFRTDRAMVSILSGLPAQPTMSIMDLPKKSNQLPSIARTLSANGYNTSFYYGGDANYSNMRSYLMATGYADIVSETDFPASQRTGKWGVTDGPVFDRLLSDIKQAREPFFMTMLTESSHEPFDVPFTSHLKEPELNAFRYADECLGRFMDALRKSPQWQNTLVVILPDHLGAYPQHIDNYALWRYELPLVMTGGVISSPQRVNTICCQTDLPATLLALLGYEHKDFPYSRDAFDPHAPHFAFFTLDDGMGMVTPDARIIHDNHSSRLVVSEGKNPETLLPYAKAYLQKLYDDIAK